MSIEDNKALVGKFQHAVGMAMMTGETDAFKDVFADDIVWHLPASMDEYAGSTFRGYDGIMEMLSAGVKYYYRPETMDIGPSTVIAEGEWVHQHFSMSAVTVTGKDYHNRYQSLFRIENGRIAEVFELFDAHQLISKL